MAPTSAAAAAAAAYLSAQLPWSLGALATSPLWSPGGALRLYHFNITGILSLRARHIAPAPEAGNRYNAGQAAQHHGGALQVPWVCFFWGFLLLLFDILFGWNNEAMHCGAEAKLANAETSVSDIQDHACVRVKGLEQ